jgi:phytoene desaturase
MSRVVVIGAGVGGLAAAIRLAAAGHTVEVHERSASAGGKLATYERDGFRFDTGPSLLTLPQVFTDLLSAPSHVDSQHDINTRRRDTAVNVDAVNTSGLNTSGLNTSGLNTSGLDAHLVNLDPVVRHVFPDGTVLDSSSTHDVFVERIRATLGPDSAEDWQRFWRRAERIWRASWRSVLRKPVTPASLAGLTWRLNDLAAIAPGRTLRGLGWHYFRDPRLRLLLDRYATYTGADPRRAPAALAAIPYAELAFGGWYLKGGLATLATALVTRCTDLGVRIVLESEATAIDAADGEVRGVHLRSAGGYAPADVVVSDVDALTLYRDLLPTPARLARLTDRSLAGFVLLLAVRGETPSLAHHNVFFPPYYDAEFDAIFGTAARRARPADDPTIFVTRAEDPTVHPPGAEAWFVLINAPRHGTSWQATDWRRPGLADSYADHVLDLLAQRGLDVRDRVLFRETRTPADLAAGTGTPGGAIYGTTGGLLRPANRGPLDNLFLVGGSVHPGGGLPMVTLSAQIAVTQIGPA